jgi:hypothetical protein
MDVFVIPVGTDSYELYYEQPVAGNDPVEPETTGFIGKWRRRFVSMLRAVEERERSGAPIDPVPKSWVGRLQDRGMAWVAERIAEQRLLWNLRGQTEAVAAHPDDMTTEQALTLVRRTLQRDYDRHRRWVVIDGLLLVITFVPFALLFVLIPGIANLPSLYLAFRTIGHFLSMRGSRHGLQHVTWSGRSCPPLGELRQLAPLDPSERESRLQDVAARLRLEQLPKFFERVAIGHS